MTGAPLPATLARRLFAFLAFAYLLTLSGHLCSGDELLVARVAEAIVTRGETSVRPIEGFESYARVDGVDGRPYTWYGIGLSVAAAPAYAAGMALEAAVPPEGVAALTGPARVLYYDRDDRDEAVRLFAATMTNPWIVALTAVLLAAVLARLGLSPRRAVLAALVFGLTGVTPFYAKTFFSEPLAALGPIAALAAWLRMRGGGPRAAAWAFAAGAAAGASVLARVSNGILLAPLAAAFLWDLLRAKNGKDGDSPRFSRPHVSLLLAAALGALVPLGLLGAYNAARFGTPLETGYGRALGLFSGDALEGAAGLLASPGRGLFVYVPWALLAIPGLVRLARRDPPLAVLTGGAPAALWALYAPWAMWDGGWCYGPRFLVPALPLLAVPAALWALDPARSRAARWIAGSLAAAGLALAARSVQVDFADFDFALWRTAASPDHALRWDPAWAPAIRYWTWPEATWLAIPRLLAGDGGAALARLSWFLLAGGTASATALGIALSRVPPGSEAPPRRS